MTVTVTDGTYSNSVYFVWTVNPAVQPAAPSLQNPGSQTSYAGQTVSAEGKRLGRGRLRLRPVLRKICPMACSIDPFTGIISGTVADDAISTTPYEVSVTAVDDFRRRDDQEFPVDRGAHDRDGSGLRRSVRRRGRRPARSRRQLHDAGPGRDAGAISSP